MCGITGIVDLRGDRSIDEAVLRRMNGLLTHRGPDGDGFHFSPGVGLGHRRLSIIDLEGGRQPLYNEDGSVVVTFNGEIFNFMEVETELLARGHTFRTRSDTEVIVHAWEEWGAECLSRFNGMFAFAVWDERQKTLFIARDRLGVKPLYYAETADGRLVFGSELKAIMAVPGDAAPHRPARGRGVLHLRLRARSEDDLPGRTEARARRLPAARARAAQARAGAVLGRAAGRRAPARGLAGIVGGGVARAAARGRAQAPRLGRAARRLPLGRHRLERRRRDDARDRRRQDPDLLDRLQGAAVRRVAVRAHGRRGEADRSQGRGRRGLRLQPARPAGRHLRRALCRQLGDPDLPGLPARAQARHGGALGRRRRRGFHRLPSLQAVRDGGGGAQPRARGRAPGRVRPARPLVSEARLGAALRAWQDHLPGARTRHGGRLPARRVDLLAGDARAALLAGVPARAAGLRRERGVPRPRARQVLRRSARRSCSTSTTRPTCRATS